MAYTQHIPFRRERLLPIAVYELLDRLTRVVSHQNFLDAMLVSIAFIAASIAFPFYPVIITMALVLALFATDMYHPFLGLIVFMVLLLPMVMYQIPAVAGVFIIVAALSLIYGYMHFRTLVFAYIIIALAFSPVGYLLVIPFVVLSAVVVGYKRSMAMALLAFIFIIMLSGASNMQNNAYIPYNATYAHAQLSDISLQYATIHKPLLSLSTFGSGAVSASSSFFTALSNGSDLSIIGVFGQTLMVRPATYAIQIGVILAMIFIVDYIIITHRSHFKATKASLVSIIYPASFIILTLIFMQQSATPAYVYLLSIISFVLGVLALSILELFNIEIVKASEVRKQDIRMKFGEAFEELAAGTTTETLDDLANYDSTKKELRDAVLAPIEQRGVARAYHMKPAKGILLFGPPGTGKTMLMRALSNEVHGAFFYVSAPNLISPSAGETERRMTQIFAMAKKHAPCILFFDEIDSLAANRNLPNVDEVHRDALSQLLVEMDGFQKVSNVIIVGATNVPNLLDPAILRAGRFDKIISVDLPDASARKKIFQQYLRNLPVSNAINYQKLAEASKRYSGADIKALCEEVAHTVAHDAIAKHKVLEITQQDLLSAVKTRKPSTSISQEERYAKFKMDFERKNVADERVQNQQLALVKDVAGLEEAKKAISDAIEVPLLHPELTGKYRLKAISGVLMFGPPGCGKTMLMRAVANQFEGKITPLELSGTDLARQGEESAVAAINETVNRAKENAPAIILIDEIDTIAPSRVAATENTIKITGELLTIMDGIKPSAGIVIIGATNRPEALDPAMLRPGRFDKLVFVGPPDKEERAALFKDALQGVPSEEISYGRLADATQGFTGADIANVCREAKTDAIRQSLKQHTEVTITTQNLLSIISKIKPSAPEFVLSTYKAFLDRYGQR